MNYDDDNYDENWEPTDEQLHSLTYLARAQKHSEQMAKKNKYE